MLIPPDSKSLDEVHQLAAEIRALQSRINEAMDRLGDILSSPGLERAAQRDPAAGAALENGAVRNTLNPSFLQLAAPSSYVRNPATGYALGSDTKFYSNYKRGLVQLVQQPLARHADSRYGLVINFADFDGDLVSLVIDGRELLAGLPTGKARLDLVVESNASQFCAVYAKCAWRTGKQWSERNFEVRSNQVSVASTTIDHFDPQATQALDLHLIFNPTSRGSVEVRRLSLAVTVEPAAAIVPAAADIFE